MAVEYPLSLIIKAVDKATAPLRAINARMKQFTAPVRKLNNSFRALSEEAGIPRLAKAVGRVGGSLRKVGSETMALGLKITAMAAGAAYGLYHIVRGAVDAGDKLGEMAQRVGLSVDAYAQLQFAAAQADVEQEQFTSSMDQFNKRLGEMKAGGGAMLEFLQKVSPVLARQMKGAKSNEEALGLMTNAFEMLALEGKPASMSVDEFRKSAKGMANASKIAALASATMGKGGLQMGQFFAQGAKVIGEAKDKYHDLAGSQAKFAEESGKLDNAMRETELAFSGLRNAAAAELFPALTELSKAITDILVGEAGNLKIWAKEAGAEISKWVKEGGVKRLVKDLKDLWNRVQTVIDRLGGFLNVLKIVAGYMALDLVVAIAGLVKSVWGLSAALLASPVGVFVLALAALAFVGYELYENWDVFKRLLGDIWDTLKAINEVKISKLSDIWSTEGREIAELNKGARPPSIADDLAQAKPSGRPQFNINRANVPGAVPNRNEAHVTVDFANLPKGARVTQDPRSTAPLDLSMGYSMVTP